MNLRAQTRLLHDALTRIAGATSAGGEWMRQTAARAIASVDVKPVTAEEKFADAVAALIDLPDAERERACRVARELGDDTWVKS